MTAEAGALVGYAFGMPLADGVLGGSAAVDGGKAPGRPIDTGMVEAGIDDGYPEAAGGRVGVDG